MDELFKNNPTYTSITLDVIRKFPSEVLNNVQLIVKAVLFNLVYCEVTF